MFTLSPSNESPKQGEQQLPGLSGTQNPNPISYPDPRQNQPSLTLETQITQTPEPENQQAALNPDHQHLHQQQQRQYQEQHEKQVIDGEEPENTVSESVVASSPHTAAGNLPPTSSRRPIKRKKGSFKCKHKAKFAAIEKKLHALTEYFNPIPFVPNKTLDFSKHEDLLKRVGLWDFAHLKFDSNLRRDLIAQLVVGYNWTSRGSYVNGCRINVSRAAVARALNLPVLHVKKATDLGAERFPEEFVSFIGEFVSNWMLLHGDMWEFPAEVLNWTGFIKDGHPERVDWAGLIWFMLEKELAQGPLLVNCYYASHLHQLIKTQKEDLLIKTTEPNEGDDVELEMVRPDEILSRPDSDEQITELSLGQMSDFKENVDTARNAQKRIISDTFDDSGDAADKVDSADEVDYEDNTAQTVKVHDDDDYEDGAQKEAMKGKDMMEFDDCRGKEQGQWHFDDKNNGEEHILRRCVMDVGKVNDDRGKQVLGNLFQDDEDEENEQAEDFSTMQKCNRFDDMSSENPMQGMGAMHMPFISELCNQSSLELLSRRTEDNMMLGGTSLFGNSIKREIDHDADTSHHAMNNNHKRIRVDGQWGHSLPDFDTCMEQIQHWAGKARIAYEAFREEWSHQANMAQQYLVDEVASKDHMILQLKFKIEELEKRRQAEITRYDSELQVMSRLVDGYRRALKDTQQAFADYRRKCPQYDEPIYKDAGAGGVVKSVKESEMEHIKRQEEERMMCNMAEELVHRFEMQWIAKFEEHIADVQLWDNRLLDVEKGIELLKESAKCGAVTDDSDT